MIVDHSLAQRTERLLAADVGAFAEGMATCEPGRGARQVEVGGGFATYTGPGLFGNRAQGVGMHGPVDAASIDLIEQFYQAHGLPPEFEVCPHADPSLLAALASRRYVPLSFRNVFAHALSAIPDPPEDIEVRDVTEENFSAWSTVLLEGFGYNDPERRDRVALWNRMLFARPEAALFIAMVDGRPAGAANVLTHGQGASLGGATTVPAARRRGVHRALLLRRLHAAVDRQCDLAIVTADPGSISARNAEQVGFHLVYTNIRFRRVPGPGP
jgi:hypothetical protein